MSLTKPTNNSFKLQLYLEANFLYKILSHVSLNSSYTEIGLLNEIVKKKKM
jgi:hypothetical protein